MNEHDPAGNLSYVQALGILGDPAGEKTILGASNDPNAMVRATVATALGSFPDKQSHDALVILSDDSSELAREYAIASLQKCGTSADLPIVLKHLNDASLIVRFAAISAAAKLDDGSAAKAIVPLLQKSDISTRRAIIAHIAEFKTDPKVFAGAIASLLNNPDADTRSCGILAAAQLKDHGSVPKLIEIATQSPKSEVESTLGLPLRFMAVNSLCAINDNRAIPILLDALNDPELRKPAAEGLIALGGRDVCDGVWKRYLNEPTMRPSTRASFGGPPYLHILGKVGDSQVRAEIAAYLTDAEPRQKAGLRQTLAEVDARLGTTQPSQH